MALKRVSFTIESALDDRELDKRIENALDHIQDAQLVDVEMPKQAFMSVQQFIYTGRCLRQSDDEQVRLTQDDNGTFYVEALFDEEADEPEWERMLATEDGEGATRLYFELCDELAIDFDPEEEETRL